jgi:D-methionine transport system substrate-binding protein
MFKQSLAVLAAAILSLSAQANEKLTVGATPVPHAEILEFVKPVLAKEGVDLDIKVFTDFIQPNLQLAEKNLDANYYQYRPFLDEFNKTRHTDLVPVVGVHIEPFGAYSSKIKDLKDLPDGASVAIPNDPVNTGRALVLLHEAGLIKLKDPSNTLATQRDIAENPKKLKIVEIEAPQLTRALDDRQIALAVINTTFSSQVGLSPTRNGLFIEDKNSPYVNIFASRIDNKDSAKVKNLVKAYQSDEVAAAAAELYKGDAVKGW